MVLWRTFQYHLLDTFCVITLGGDPRCCFDTHDDANLPRVNSLTMGCGSLIVTNRLDSIQILFLGPP